MFYISDGSHILFITWYIIGISYIMHTNITHEFKNTYKINYINLKCQ